MKLVGIDRARGNWLVVESDERLRGLVFGIAENLTDYLTSLEGSECLVVVDVPIGLPSSGPRAVDQEARRLLGQPRGSSVFPAPMRAALAGSTHQEASALNREASGRGLSIQAFGILEGIRQLDGFVTPDRQTWLREGHPEVSFAMLSEEQTGVVERKQSAEGAAIRMQLLSSQLSAPDVDEVRRGLGRGNAGRDDVLDALAMVVSASRLHSGDAVVLPVGAIELDGRGLRMEMVA